MPFKATLLSAWEAVRTSYWFVPGAMVAGAILLSYMTIEIDRLIGDGWDVRAGWFYTGNADAAREMLTTIAGSMIATAGVVFSITIVALTLASNQFGSRMLRNFMRDLANQVVLGTFVAAFIYCLLVLRNVHEGGDGVREFVPQLSLIVALLLALAGVGVLIFFIHHVSVSIQAPNVVASVARELGHAIEELYPERIGESPVERKQRLASVERQVPAGFDVEAVAVPADSDGHVERIEEDQVLAVAQRHDLLLRVVHRPGQFVERGEAVIEAWPPSRVDDRVIRQLQETFTVRRERSLSQDAEYPVVQLVEVAVRALSPGTNDPSTAMLCLDYLGASVGRLAERAFPSAYRLDEEGRLRVVAPSLSLAGYIDAAFTQIRQNAKASPAVLLRMFEVFERLGRRLDAGDEAARARLADHVQMVHDDLVEAATHPHERKWAEQWYAKVLRALQRAGACEERA